MYGVFLVLGLFFIMMVNFLSDPFQFYRFSPSKELDGYDRFQVAGFIKNFKYDQVILGTSMTQNFSLNYIKDKLGTDPIRLSLAGATVQEQSEALQAAIKTGKVKTVIWGVDQCYLSYEQGKFDETFPIDIYRNNYRGHFQYLMSKNIFFTSVRRIRQKFSNKVFEVFMSNRKKPYSSMTLENYNHWHHDYKFSKEIILKDFNKRIKEQTKIVSSAIEEDIVAQVNVVSNFKRDVVDIVKDNPNISFTVFFPPYSLAYHKLSFSNDRIAHIQYKKNRESLMRLLADFDNVILYDFETCLPIIANLDNYKDMNHYSQEVNHYMVDAFSKKKHVVTKNNIPALQALFQSLPEQAFQE